MKNKKLLKIAALTLAVGVCACFALTGLNSATASADSGATAYAAPDSVSSATKSAGGTGNLGTSTDGTPILKGDELFSARDLEQSPDLSEAVILSVSDGQTLSVSEEGVYVLRGTAKNATVVVEAEDSAKVQLVLDGLSITNDSFPCIYVKSADKVFITTVSDSSLSVTDGFVSDGDTRTDAVIFSRDDLVLNGSAALTISSACNGVSCKDDLKLTGGSYVVTAASKCFEANDSIRVAGGSFTLSAGTDGLHAENDEDDSLGYIYIGGGQFSIRAGDDGIHAKAFVQIDGGSFTISAAEGIEATAVQLNDGSISIESWDDGVNAARKSTAYAVCVEINGGEINIVMGAGDTDGIDSNGSLIVNGGSVNITGSSGFDYEGSASYNGGTLILNGQTLDSIPNQMMGGAGGMGGFGGQPGGMSGRGRRG
jgi:hypothetical protein